ncbi:MAG TPA: hypothetical protein VNP20_01825 [Nocardioidaceae bacterium]|nr:hypothetical protein [Nocardioidaceae bacterium]
MTLSVELGGRRVSQSHCEQAKAAAHAAFIASLSGHGYSFVNQRARGEYLYVGWDDES